MHKIVFVADVFADEYAGGAELTTEALVESCPFDYIKIKSKDVTIQTLEMYKDAFWIFGNFVFLNLQLVPTIAANIRYAVLEYDYKFCKYRSIEKHQSETGEPCDCSESQRGKLISAFFYAADKLFWMSNEQEERYIEFFPFLELHGRVLGSVFSRKDLQLMDFLKGGSTNQTHWLVQDSDSWIKNKAAAIEWCKDNDHDVKLFKGYTRTQLLNAMHDAEGFCFLPSGGDTCPRVVIEAKVLGCDLKINENVQMAKEAWFDRGTPDSIVNHLKDLPNRFWHDIKVKLDITSTIGAYTTTYNCISQKYPFEECIQSLIDTFDDVVVVDAGSTDGTWERLQEIDGIRAYQHKVDFDHPRWAIHSDGDLKTTARKYLDTDWCWQMDVDEILPLNQREKIQNLLQSAPKAYDLISLPIVEYWGSSGKVRMDVNPWKWRLSRNHEGIIHGIPKELRLKDEDGFLYAAKGTDSCDYVFDETFNRVPHVSFYRENVHKVRAKALHGDEQARESYENWYNLVIEQLPTVYHYSWFDIERKINSYKTHWSAFWKSMYGLEKEDTAENNVCFDKRWSDVTDDDIKVLSQRLEEEKGGHIFHEKVDWSKKTPWVELKTNGPLTFD